jgi:AcrR family transcriptional regulator
MQRRLSRKESQEQTRTRLLEAAETVFSRRGFHGASIDEVAAEAGYSKGAVYSNFASKEDLLLELIDRRFEQDARDFSGIQGMIGPKPQHGETSGFTTAMMEDRDWVMLVLEFFLYAMRDESVREKVAGRMKILRSQMREQLERMYAEHGHQPALPVEIIPWAIIALGPGMGIQFFLEPEAFPENLYERVLEQILK